VGGSARAPLRGRSLGPSSRASVGSSGILLCGTADLVLVLYAKRSFALAGRTHSRPLALWVTRVCAPTEFRDPRDPHAGGEARRGLRREGVSKLRFA